MHPFHLAFRVGNAAGDPAGLSYLRQKIIGMAAWANL